MSIRKGNDIIAGTLNTETYYTKTETNNLLNNKATIASVNLINNKPYFSFKMPITTLAQGETYIKTFTITPIIGRPIFLSFSGDNNPNTDSAWFRYGFMKNDVYLQRNICESRTSSQNIPFSVSYLDIDVVANTTYTYKVFIEQNSGTTVFGESDTYQSPCMLAYEI